MTSLDERVVVPSAKGKAANSGVPTQVANPSRASWRTFWQSLIAFLASVNAVAVAVLGIINSNPTVASFLPASLLGWITLVANGVVVFGALLSKVAALIMADPAVNAWIEQYVPWLAAIKPAAS